MPEDAHPNRKSPRLPEYDYALAGTYFVTICTAQRKHLFGKIIAHEMIYSRIGNVAFECWRAIPDHFPSVELDLFVVMPNHVHGLITIIEDHADVGTRYISSAYTTANDAGLKQSPNGFKKQSLSAIVSAYKAAITRKTHSLFGTELPVLWQTRYHDHIVRDERGLNQLREYILINPARWAEDVFYKNELGNA